MVAHTQCPVSSHEILSIGQASWSQSSVWYIAGELKFRYENFIIHPGLLKNVSCPFLGHVQPPTQCVSIDQGSDENAES